MLRQIVGKFLRAHSFRPSFFGLFTNPFWIARSCLWNAIEEQSHLMHGRLLDIGCGSKPYKALLDVETYIGLEYDNESARSLKVADIFYTGTTFPFADGEFDSILCNQVLEHVFQPDQFLSEIARVLKTDGTLLLTIPFVWDEHEQPYDYARYTSFGLSHLVTEHGFSLISQKKLCNDVSILFQLFNLVLYKWVSRSRAMQILVTIFPISLISISGYIFGRILPKNNDLYLDQLIVAKKL
jgi:SAM-dependent methyltransferase